MLMNQLPMRGLVIAIVMASATPAGAADFAFAPPIVSALPKDHTPIVVRLGDLDGNGILDAVATGRNWDGEPNTNGRVAVMRGIGDGTFELWSLLLIPQGHSEDAAIADLNGDGFLDVAVSVSGPRGRIAAFLGNGNGGFAAPTFTDIERGPRGMTLADLDGDGDLDAAAVNYSSGSVSIARNDSGVFTTIGVTRLMPYLGGLPFPQQAVAVDIEGDGDADVLTTTIGGGRVSVLRGRNDGTLASGVDWKPALINKEAPAVIGTNIADFDGDGDFDLALPVLLVTQSQKLVVLRGDGTGAFPEQSVFDADIFSYAWCSVPIDVDSDGRIDLAIGTALSGFVSFVRNETESPAGPLAFVAQPLVIPYGLFVRDLVSADIDGDGDADLVGIEIAGSTLFTLLNATAPDNHGGAATAQRSADPPKAPMTPPLKVPERDITGDGRFDAADVARWLGDWVPSLQSGLQPGLQPGPEPASPEVAK
ncbi:MAG: VCBS repeat-containing protein [Phycisphaerae bacterium]|nr:VCBS repeat-containing protein [Phycisphaerae bacterium]